MTARTFTVVTSYVGRDGQHRVYVNGHALPLLTEVALAEGAAVIIQGDRAVPHERRAA